MTKRTYCALACLFFLANGSLVSAQYALSVDAYASLGTLSDSMKIEEYADLPYFFLGNGKLEFSIDIEPESDHVLDLLWGSKSDQRSATLVVNGVSQDLTHGGYDGFEWMRIELPEPDEATEYTFVLSAAGEKNAFISEIRLVTSGFPIDAPFGASEETTEIVFKTPPPRPMQDGWRSVESFEGLPELERNGEQARRAMRQSRDFVNGWMTVVDPESGLIPENLSGGRDRWNGRNNAADNYAFMVLTAALTDREMFDGPLLDMLRTEERLTNRVDRLGDVYKFSTQDFEHDNVDMTRLIFDNSEYVKDGLMPLTEWLGPSPWSERMSGIIDDIWKHAPIETDGGPIPSTNDEVNGEMMQLTSRYFWMTGDERYLDYATRIADYYLLGDRHPTRNSTSLRLRDHGCELISGLTEVYVAVHYERPEKAELYKEPLYAVLDRILEVGLDENGMMYNAINPIEGVVTNNRLSDNWGYNYNGFYAVYLVDGEQRYRDAVVKSLNALELEQYCGYSWEGSSHDGYADSIECAINLYNRELVPAAGSWIDSQMRIMLAMQREDGIIGGWHGDGNFARTAIMYALMKQQGVTTQPWREDVRLGAVEEDGELTLMIATDEPWKGRIVFDQPRHKTYMGMPLDYPRINQVPEWYVVEADAEYELRIGLESTTYQGTDLIEGLEIEVGGIDQPVSMTVRKTE